MKNKGFTLLEVIIYVGLFAILMGGGVLAAYNLIASNNHNQSMFLVYDEGNFLMSKINWVISGTSAIQSPVPGTPSSNLLVTKIDGSTVGISLSGNNLVITYGNTAPIILNNNNVKISNVLFDNQISSTSQLVKSSLTITTTTNDGKIFSQNFNSTKYIRK